MWTWILLVAAGVTGLAASTEMVCSSGNHCTCHRVYSEWSFHCRSAKDEPLVTGKIQPGFYIRLQCEQYRAEALEAVAGLKLGAVHSLRLSMCPPPAHSYAGLMASIGVPTVKHIQVTNVRFNGSLTGAHLADLPFVDQLSLSDVGLERVPADLLSGLPSLRWLDLMSNRLRLPPGFFAHTPKLEFVELGNNDMDVDALGSPDVFRGLDNLYYLNLWSNRLSDLTGNILDGAANLSSLDLSTNHIAVLPPSSFAKLSNLSIINLSNNNFSELPADLFRGNPSLKILQMRNNRRSLKTLPSGLLANLTDFEDLLLQRVNLSSVPEDLFWGSVNLQNVSFSQNLLESVPELLFRDASRLLKVDLSYNRLEEIPDRLFAATTKLQYLYLDHNRLKTLSGSVFGVLVALEELHLENNELRDIDKNAFQNMQNLKRAHLEYNRIAEFTAQEVLGDSLFYISNELTYLNMSHNNITEVFSDWKISKTLLVDLDLSYNNITQLTVSDVDFVPSVRLDLSHNRITVVKLEDMEALALGKEEKRSGSEKKPISLNLGHNPIQCDCTAFSLAKFLQGRMDKAVYRAYTRKWPESVVCAGPGPFRGRPLDQVALEELTCALEHLVPDSRCPDSCRCHYRPHDLAMLVDCSGRGLTRLPPSLPNPYPPHFTHIELNFSSNSLASWPNRVGTGYEKVTILDLSNNNLVRINVSSLPPKLEVLQLEGNNLTRMDAETIRFLNESETLRNITLHGNPWLCDCETRSFLDFLHKNFVKIWRLNNITCSSGYRLSKMTASDLCPPSRLVWGIISGIVAVLGLVTGALIALYYRYRDEVKVWLYAHRWCLWFVTEEELDRNKIYDAFISYSHHDEDFVVSKLVPGLEEDGPVKFKLCLHYRDWIVGDFIPNQIARSVEDSRRTVVVLSKSFIESVWGKMEFRAAHSQALTEGRARVIVILYGEVDTGEDMDPELKAYLATNTYVKWGDPWFWDKLRYALPHPPKHSKKKKNIALEVSQRAGDTADLITTPNSDTFLIDPLASDKI